MDGIEQGTSLTSFYQTMVRFFVEKMGSSDRTELTTVIKTTPDNNVVLIIDESIRSDHLSINGYQRETTPYLEKIASETNAFYNWGIATAGATCSFQSNALILTGVIPSTNSFNVIYKYPTLFQYAKMMNYKTYYIDVQTNSLWNGLNSKDIKYIDQWLMAKDIGSDIYSDFQAAEIIKKIILKSTGNFIVLNKRGVHFLYENCYPSSENTWGPIPQDYHRQPELVTNSYDNGVRFNVNTFFEHLLADPESALANTVYIYTSDHGETLFEDGAQSLHCNRTWQEATVPLIIFGRLHQVGDVTYKASHANIFATVLDIMNVPVDARLFSYASSLLHVKSTQTDKRSFFSGGMELILYPK
jgi:glucan phosphoethanolaminetransferase (alkaline phosphatase superfamily)